jgi:hypothetical protein
VVIGDFDIEGISLAPAEAEPPLIVDADAVLAGTIPPKCFQTIARRNSQEIEGCRCVQHVEFGNGAMEKIGGETCSLATPKFFRFLVSETLNHRPNVLYFRTFRKW